MQSEARRHKSCTHVHELSHFLFPSIQSADITNSPRVRLLLNWRLDPEGAIFSGSRTTGSYAAHASSSLSVIL